MTLERLYGSLLALERREREWHTDPIDGSRVAEVELSDLSPVLSFVEEVLSAARGDRELSAEVERWLERCRSPQRSVL